MQNYIRFQNNSKNNFDLITQVVLLLNSYQINDATFDIVQQCLDSLTEFVQGPCRANQQTICNSKYLEYAVAILGEDEKLFTVKKVKKLKVVNQEDQPSPTQFKFKDTLNIFLKHTNNTKSIRQKLNNDLEQYNF